MSDLDFLTAFEVGLHKKDDKLFLRWAAENERVLLTHDRQTMPGHYAALINLGKNHFGDFVDSELGTHWKRD